MYPLNSLSSIVKSIFGNQYFFKFSLSFSPSFFNFIQRLSKRIYEISLYFISTYVPYIIKLNFIYSFAPILQDAEFLNAFNPVYRTED